MTMTETSTVTFIGEVTVVHESDLSDKEVVRLAFEALGDGETDILDVMVVRDTDADD